MISRLRGISVRPVVRAASVLCCLGSVAVLIAACGGSARTVRLVSVPTSCYPQCRGSVDASDPSVGILRGSARVDGGCLWIGSTLGRTGKPIPKAKERIPVVWPSGYKARFGRTIELIAPSGRVVAKVGDRIEFGGMEEAVRRTNRCMLGQRIADVVQDDIYVLASTHRAQ